MLRISRRTNDKTDDKGSSSNKMETPKSKLKTIEGYEARTGKSWSQIVINNDFPDPLAEEEAQNKWSNIPWRKVEIAVFKLQKRIYQASNQGSELTQAQGAFMQRDLGIDQIVTG
jgi:hypothetical protein